MVKKKVETDVTRHSRKQNEKAAAHENETYKLFGVRVGDGSGCFIGQYRPPWDAGRKWDFYLTPERVLRSGLLMGDSCKTSVSSDRYLMLLSEMFLIRDASYRMKRQGEVDRAVFLVVLPEECDRTEPINDPKELQEKLRSELRKSEENLGLDFGHLRVFAARFGWHGDYSVESVKERVQLYMECGEHKRQRV